MRISDWSSDVCSSDLIVQNERGRYFSQGDYEILGYPQTDGYDALSWIAEQPWSNGKVGTLGCSSSAEWQLALAGMDHPAHAAMVPMAAGAGIGKVGRFREQGNFYRSEEHTSELQSLMRISYAAFCLKK